MSNNGLAIRHPVESTVAQYKDFASAITDPDLKAIFENLPPWLQLLVGTYPQSWANELTFLVLESKFARYGDRVMLAAAEAYTDEQEQFPTPAALRPYVDRFVHDGAGEFIRSMTRAGYVFKGDIDNVMHFESVATGQPTVVYH